MSSSPFSVPATCASACAAGFLVTLALLAPAPAARASEPSGRAPAPQPPAPVAPLSSHREAPGITETPKVDGTDFYMFNSYEAGREDTVTFIADYLPLQDPYGGPNYFNLDPDARYEIHVDNDGDAVQDISFRFTFYTVLKDIALPVGAPGSEKIVSIPLVQAGSVSLADATAQNVAAYYSIDVIGMVGGHAIAVPVLDAQTGETRFAQPLDNIGPKTIADYATYAQGFVHDVLLPGGVPARVFVGQRKDPFVVSLGATFDLVNLNPLGPPDGGQDDLKDKNVTALELEIPKSFLVAGQPVLGAWTTASLRQSSKLVKAPTFEQPTQERGRFVQVSRLGSPLVNELVIGLKDKNRFNASVPADDAQFLDYVTNPVLPELLEVLFGVRAPDLFPRADLVQAFLTGVPGLNENGAVGEMLRINTGTPAVPAAQQNPLGVIAGDVAGFPNGRRPGDDVVDIALRVVMGVLLDSTVAPDGQLPYTDGAAVDASFFDGTFPYLRSPIPGGA